MSHMKECYQQQHILGEELMASTDFLLQNESAQIISTPRSQRRIFFFLFVFVFNPTE